MSAGRQTDERLKYHLNSRQPDRERMCLDLLRLDGSYTKIEPRRPEGGPDGGRDIQCYYRDFKCFGAVGFKNNANDSDEQKREIKRKFKDDLSSALEAEPSLKAFVFLTNIDLTPSEQDELKRHARDLGLDFVNVLYRERLRILLDSVGGYSTRFSYLDIPLSDAEQKDFFARFGDAIQNIVVGKLEAVEQRMEEILYRNWLRGRCRDISVNVRLKNTYEIKGSDHQPYRFALMMHRGSTHGEGKILLGCYSIIHQTDNLADFEVKRFNYTDSDLLPNERNQFKRFSSRTRVLNQPFDDIRFGLSVPDSNPLVSEYGMNISELKQYSIDFYCDSGWADKVRSIEVWYDDYLVTEFENDECCSKHTDSKYGIPHWPEEANHLKDRPVQYWRGWIRVLDDVCRRRRVGEW